MLAAIQKDTIESLCEVLDNLETGVPGYITQLDSASALDPIDHPLISTDPPYYDNVPYADLSDFFYVWLRHMLWQVYPDIFSTLLVPKSQELVADPFRHGGREQAQRFFEDGLAKAFGAMRARQHPDYPTTIFYAFKQSEEENHDAVSPFSGQRQAASTGWETMLQGLIDTGFAITGTWPLRTELGNRTRNQGSNALASSIVLVCRPRPADAPMATRKELIRELQHELPRALELLISGAAGVSPIAPVDLAQAAIGPGMAIFSRYRSVLEATGQAMGVRAALELINVEIDRYFQEQEGEQDAPTRFCVAWYRTHGTADGAYGVAETLSKATVVDIERLERQGLLTKRAGKVRLRPAAEYPVGAWDPATARPLTTWEAAHRLAAALQRGGVEAAAPIAQRLGGKAEEARALAYLLYSEANRRGWASEALGYNDLVASWSDILKRVGETRGFDQDTLM